MSKEAMKLALDGLIAEYYMENSSFARRVDDIFKEALVAPEDSSVVQSEEYKDAIEVSVIFHEGQRMFAVPKQPAQRKPLTDEELDAMFSKTLKGKKLVNWVARAIEAAHGIKEKNT